MDNERIEKMLNKIGSADVPAEIKQIAENAADEFSRKIKTMPERKSIQEIIMKGRLIKLAVAAVIFIAVCIGISFFGSTSGVALADVLEKVEQAQAFMYKMKMNLTGGVTPSMREVNAQTEGTVIISNEYGSISDMTTIESSTGRKKRQIGYTLLKEKKSYTIMPDEKKYMVLELSDDLLARMKKQINDPRDFLRQLLSYEYTDISIGKAKINGVEVEGFQTTDPAFANGAMEEVKLTLWVDTKTKLPVREEIYYKVNENMQMEGVIEDFKWDLQVDASAFKPIIPQNYTSLGEYKIPSFNEEMTIEGLRSFADSTGKYPEKLSLEGFMESVKAFLRQKVDVNSLSEEELLQKVAETTRPLQSLLGFYMSLVQDKKEPAYYGDIVGPADTDKVLMRWKTGDNEYRVIYGDLSVETVDGSVLTELESQIQQ